MPFGKWLREARIHNNMTQEELAKKVGVTKGAIGNYESEVSSPKETILIELMNVLHIDANYLYQDYIQARESLELSKDESALIITYRNLTDYGKQLMMDRAAELKLLYGEKPESSRSKKAD